MKELLKSRKTVVSLGIVILIVFFAAIFYFMSAKSSQNKSSTTTPFPTQVPVLTLSASDIGLTFTESADMHTGTMIITKTADIASVDYQLTYNALVSGQQVTRGTIGHVVVKKPGQQVSQDMKFGTCSDVCHYDSGITDVKLIVKVTKTDGKIYQVTVMPSP